MLLALLREGFLYFLFLCHIVQFFCTGDAEYKPTQVLNCLYFLLLPCLAPPAPDDVRTPSEH